MQVTKNSNNKSAHRRAVKETILLGIVFLIALALFIGTLYFIASREAGETLQNRPRGLLLGWLTTLTIGLILGKTRHTENDRTPKPLIVARHALQAVMLLFFFIVLAYASYFFYTTRGLVLQRPWGLLIGWFAFLVFIALFARTRHIIRLARRKQRKLD